MRSEQPPPFPERERPAVRAEERKPFCMKLHSLRENVEQSAEEHGFATAGFAGDAENFIPADIQTEPVKQRLFF